MNRICFVVNPISGGKDKGHIIGELEAACKREGILPNFIETTLNPDEIRVAIDACNEIFYIVIGGDGTINAAASALAGTEKIMGILPFGSGNGLARTLGLNQSVSKLMARVKEGKWRPLDVIGVNDAMCFNLGGVGLDAVIAERFESSGKRGFLNYLKIATPVLLKDKMSRFAIEIDQKAVEFSAFQVSFANSRQYGNNFSLTPHAELADGLMDLLITSNCSNAKMIADIIAQLAFKSIKPTVWDEGLRNGMNVFQVADVILHNLDAMPMHIDGEVRGHPTHIKLSILPEKLRVLA
ncbi:MAG: hypothetical protein IPQ04_03265 [Saprospiraceae bacterium]|nr:hypothetical protein [Saprospiraceae bacterium]